MRRAIPRPQGSGKKNPMTPAGYQRLASELERLRNVERPLVVQEVQDAAAQGDRSENAEYKYGKIRLREIDKRCTFLAGRLEHAVIIDPTKLSGDVARFGAYVEAEDEHGTKLRFQLVGVDEANPDEGRLSIESPLGRCLLEHRPGDVVTFDKPRGGPTEVELQSVHYGERPPWET